jgi:hypothetical protein
MTAPPEVPLPSPTVPPAAGLPDFWVRERPGVLVHDCAVAPPLVLCLQGRKVVLQVEAGGGKGLSYTARFFNVEREPLPKRRFQFESGEAPGPVVTVGGQPFRPGVPSAARFDGRLAVTYPPVAGVTFTRTVYPSTAHALVLEEWQARATGGRPVSLAVAPGRHERGMDEVTVVWTCPGFAATLQPGAGVSFAAWVLARRAGEPDPAVDVAAERAARVALADAAWRGPGRLETPEPLLDEAFALQKFHVLESPIETYRGLITHNGSLTYSPGVWANDPVEYSSPLFPFFGDTHLNRACVGMYRIWRDHCREHGIVPFPGSFEGPDLRLTQKERGDDAMVLYGLSAFLLFLGDAAAAAELWPLVEASAASVLGHTTAEGVVASETDEMEDRYPTGDANLSTSSLACGGYRLAACLARSLGRTEGAEFDRRAAALRRAIESYFGAEVEGFRTYRYYAGNTTLRGWILLPLAMGVTERRDGTVAALTSDRLWPDRHRGGDILAESTRPTEWGRETYYALRVLFKAGRTEEALDLTRRVVRAQMFGGNGPYPDEDAVDMLCPGSLYPRVFTEGMFGIVPTGLDSFDCTPWLPREWPRMALRDVRAFGRAWDLVVERDGERQKVTVTCRGSTLLSAGGPAGTTFPVKFPAGTGGSA